MLPGQPKKQPFKCPTFAVPAKNQDSAVKPVEEKKRKEDGVSGTTAKDKKPRSTKNHAETGKQPADKHNERPTVGTEKKEPTANKDKKDQPPTLPVKSRTDAEYEEIFVAAIETVMQLDMEVPAKNQDSAVKPVEEKKIKEDSVSGTTAKDKKPRSTKNPAETGKQPADKHNERPTVGTEKKEPTAKKDKKDRPPTLPVKSLTDAEYEEIFVAAIETVMQLDMEVWKAKTTSPVIIKPRRGKITVGKKVKRNRTPQISPENTQATDDGKDGDSDREDAASRVDEPIEVSTGLDSDDDQHASVEDDKTANNGNLEVRGQEEVKGKDVKGQKVRGHEEVKSKDVEGQEIKGQEVGGQEVRGQDVNGQEEVLNEPDAELEHLDSAEDVQQQNETTPAVSEAGSDVTPHPVCATPPPKKKNKPHSHKKNQLEPKALPFAETKKGTPVKEKIKRLKQMRKEHEPSHKKKDSVKRLMKDDINRDEKKRQKLGHKTGKKQQMLEREMEENGEAYNSCDKPEEIYDEADHIYTKFAEGSIVWAKAVGYPWWPAMVEMDPDAHTYFTCGAADSMIPTHYHVVFFDDKVSRCWVKVAQVKQFKGSDVDDDVSVLQVKKKGPTYKQEISLAKKNAKKACSCSLKERVELFGFAARYKGKWGSIELNSSPESDVKPKLPPRKKHRKQSVGAVGQLVSDILDEDTLDEALNYTEDVLDNVEEVLDSLDSQLDDSDQDEDFIPDELVVVESRKRSHQTKGDASSSKARKHANIEPISECEYSDNKPNTDGKSDSDIKDTSQNDRAIDKNKDFDKSETNNNHSEASKINIKYDMDFDDEQQTQSLSASDIHKTKTDEDALDKEQKKDDHAAAPEIGKGKDHTMNMNKEGTVSTDDVPKKKQKKQKQNLKKKSEAIDGMLETNTSSKPEQKKNICDLKKKHSGAENKTEQNERQPDTEAKVKQKKKCSAAKKDFFAPAAKTNCETEKPEEKTTPVEVQPKGDEKKQNTKKSKTVSESKPKCVSDVELDLGLQTCEIGKFKTNLDNSCQNQNDSRESGDEFDFDLEENCPVVDTLSAVVPDIALETSNSQTSKFQDSSQVESDNDFELEEHSMYDDEIDSNSKLRQRDAVTVLPAGLTQHSEDSDPFDMFEE